jgi:transposase
VYQFETLLDVILTTYIEGRIGMESLVVGTKDQLRIQIISKISKGMMRANEALILFQVSERTLRRWLRAYEKEGIAFVSHGNKGKIALKSPQNFTKSRKIKPSQDG